jgi:hypothetical protein
VVEAVLTAEQHRITCVHEAAHAVVFALHQHYLAYSVEVVPVGTVIAEAVLVERKGAARNALGLVCGSSMPGGMYIHVDDYGFYDVDRKRYRADLKNMEEHAPGIGRHARQEMRAYVRGCLAGPVSEEIMRGATDIWFEPWDGLGGDIDRADALCRLLPFRNEYEKLLEETVSLLRTPDIWTRILRLADALAVAGRLEGEELDQFLRAGGAA